MINVIWQTSGKATEFEKSYIQHCLLRKISCSHHFDNGRCEFLLPDPLVIYNSNAPQLEKRLIDYFERLRELAGRLYLLHLSNERCNQDLSYYSIANHVFRQYHSPHLQCDFSRTTIIPLGYQSDFHGATATAVKASERQYSFAFIGQPKQDRQLLLDELNALTSDHNLFIHCTTQWDCPSKILPSECSRIYSDTLFVPCPMGNISVDSFRLYEALQCGCIPIVKKYGQVDYFSYLPIQHPLPTVTDWSEIRNILLNLGDKNKLNNLQEACQKWWLRIKDFYANSIRAITCN